MKILILNFEQLVLKDDYDNYDIIFKETNGKYRLLQKGECNYQDHLVKSAEVNGKPLYVLIRGAAETTDYNWFKVADLVFTREETGELFSLTKDRYQVTRILPDRPKENKLLSAQEARKIAEKSNAATLDAVKKICKSIEEEAGKGFLQLETEITDTKVPQELRELGYHTYITSESKSETFKLLIKW